MEQQTKSTKSSGAIICISITVVCILLYTVFVYATFNDTLNRTKAELRQTQVDLTKTTSLLRLTQDELAEFKSNVTNEITAIDKEFSNVDTYLDKQHKLNEKLVLLSNRLATNVATNNYYLEKTMVMAIDLTERAKLSAKRLDQHDVKIEKHNDTFKAILETIEIYH